MLNKLRISHTLYPSCQIFAEGTIPHARCQMHQAASVSEASVCVCLCHGEGPLYAVFWREEEISLWQCQHSTPVASCQRFCAILPGFRFPPPKHCPICCFAMDVLLSILHFISIPLSVSGKRKISLHFGSVVEWQATLNSILELPGL